jgi:cytochrome c oxidase subunit 4
MPTQDHSDEFGHISPHSLYLKIFGALLVLTVITVGVTRIDFGTMNIVVAMIIASAKAMLVALFFMHLKYERFTTWVYAIFPLVLLTIMMAGVFIDNPFRATPGPIESAMPAPVAESTH